jgi:hypothetical protein
MKIRQQTQFVQDELSRAPRSANESTVGENRNVPNAGGTHVALSQKHRHAGRITCIHVPSK